MFHNYPIETEEPDFYPVLPEKIELSLLSRFSTNLHVLVHEKDSVETGSLIAQSDFYDIHSSISGVISKIESSKITIENSFKKTAWMDSLNKTVFKSNSSADYSEYLKEIGLLGMGGALFPASLKIKSALNCHTLIINAAECEPYTSSDLSILLHHSRWIKKGVETTLEKCKIKNVILAVKNNARLVSELKKTYSFPLLLLPETYPAGAERLILKKLLRTVPSFRNRPTDYGFLVQNVSSLRAIGRSLLDNIPVIERPLTFAVPEKKIFKNIIVPVGISVHKILEHFSHLYDEKKEMIIFSGLMMGENKSLYEPVTKGTTSIFIISKKSCIKTEKSCIHCGNCIDACPLGLHPILMANQIKKKEKTSALFSHLQECFLCGKCEAVCPSYIPLVEYFKEAKTWSKS